EDVMALNRKVKDALDPLGILNPGAVIAVKEASLD
ncbi:FAD-linked oxidase C-terminal domain-containing protein, partial [Rhodococcus erythropolis]|nr:FAD-linked oxidase C-terminal domain-containing protein [Rhodococcus erythropolis]